MTDSAPRDRRVPGFAIVLTVAAILGVVAYVLTKVAEGQH